MTVIKKGLFDDAKYDIPAGLVVYLIALPLCLGIALASTGRPDLLFSGIISGIIGGLIVGFVSGSSLGVSGPAAGLVVIVLSAIENLGTFEAFTLAVLISGVIQLLAGILKAGVIGNYFPSAVIKGMLAAIGITLILKEIPHAVGYDEDFFGDEAFKQADGRNTFSELFYVSENLQYGAVIITVVSLALLVLFERPFMKKIGLFRFLPGALMVVLFGILLNFIFGQYYPDFALRDNHLVQLPVATNASEFFSFFRLPDWKAFSNPDVYVTAFTLAIVASLETLLCVEATDKLDPFHKTTPTNRELIAQGFGNITAGLIGGLPITQVIVRSSANIGAGGRTKLSTIVHGAIMLLSAIFIPRFLNLIPLASLAAVLLLVGYKLARISIFKSVYKLGWDQFGPFVVTVMAILLTDLLKGIVIGMCVAFYFILRKNYAHSYHYQRKEENGKDVITLELSEEVTFLNKGSIAHTLENLPEGSTVIIDGDNSMNIDYDVIEIIQDFREHKAPRKNINVVLKDLD